MTNREYMESLDDREFARILAAVAGHEGNKEEVDFWEYWLRKKKVKSESDKSADTFEKLLDSGFYEGFRKE